MKAFLRHIYPFFLAPLLLLSGCYDDTFEDFRNPGDYPEGDVLVEMRMDFEPFAARSVGTRSNPGNTLDRLDDLCLVAYDIDGNLMEGFPVQITEAEHGLKTDLVPRENGDASNGDKAEDKTWQATFKLQVPYGRYYIYGVANLGTYDKSGNVLRTTMDELGEGGKYHDALQNRETFLAVRTKWDADNCLNNGEMLGYFTDGRQSSPTTGKQMNDKTVDVNRPGMTLHCWLRRCASKVTIDFDGSALSDKVTIYIKRATIHDIPDGCAIGMPNNANATDPKIITYKDADYRPDNTGDHIDYGTGADYNSWPAITNQTPYIMENGQRKQFHNYESEALFLYENMQGDNDEPKGNKEQHAGSDGFVIGADDKKDNVPYGSYIEVEAYYERQMLTNEKSKGKIIYRFMLGKDVLKNFDVERNYHYKLTLCPRGYGNDVDWHIEYREESGFEYKDPYYVSYLYNHDSTMRFRYTPPQGEEIDHLEAEIVENNWWPDDTSASYYKDAVTAQLPGPGNVYPASHELAGRMKYLGNGFLSLWETDDTNLGFSDMGVSRDGWAETASNQYMNDNYFYKSSKSTSNRDRSKRTYYFNGQGDDTNAGREAYTLQKQQDDSYMINIPMFTRAKTMVKESGYTGNNPYESSSRTARVKVTVYLKKDGKIVGTDQKILRIEQVPRITNPKGIYRRSGNNENFEVVLTQKKSDNGTEFETFKSDGPWMAEVIGDQNFINLNGRSTIKGNNDEIRFNVRFNKMNRDDKVRNAVIRVRYHNYSCVHLIFVRQGYSSQQMVKTSPRAGATPAEWHTCNLVAYDAATGEYVEASDPRDEGSMFKYGNLTDGIDVSSNSYNQDCTAPSNFQTVPSSYDKASPDIMKPFKNALTWTGIKAKYKNADGNVLTFPSDAGVAQMCNFEELYNSPNIEHGFGVLYADGATTTQLSSRDVYGYCRHDADCGKRGMCGLFVYYWDRNNSADPFTARNLFFPIGRSGYGHRAHWTGNASRHGVLRYACGRYSENKTYYTPLFYDIYMRRGAIYWAHQEATAYDWGAEKDQEGCVGMDINFFTFDVNEITNTNVIKDNQWGGAERLKNENVDACFVRRVGHQVRGVGESAPPRGARRR